MALELDRLVGILALPLDASDLEHIATFPASKITPVERPERWLSN